MNQLRHLSMFHWSMVDDWTFRQAVANSYKRSMVIWSMVHHHHHHHHHHHQPSSSSPNIDRWSYGRWSTIIGSLSLRLGGNCSMAKRWWLRAGARCSVGRWKKSGLWRWSGQGRGGGTPTPLWSWASRLSWFQPRGISSTSVFTFKWVLEF